VPKSPANERPIAAAISAKSSAGAHPLERPGLAVVQLGEAAGDCAVNAVI
jgi:hypothetical protein